MDEESVSVSAMFDDDPHRASRTEPNSLSTSLLYTDRLDSTIDTMKEETQTAVHFLGVKQLLATYQTSAEAGLSSAAAAQLLHRNGPNMLRKLRGTTVHQIILFNLFGCFHCILWFLAIFSITAHFLIPHNTQATKHVKNEYLYVSLVILGTILGTASFGIYQDLSTKNIMPGFKKMLPVETTVIRDGVTQSVPTREIVVGDIVLMYAGEIVPADVRILESTNFRTCRALLTGDTSPVTHTIHFTNTNPLESANMAYFGCPIAEGQAKGLVIHTGKFTEIGKIAGLVTGLKKKQTPLAKEIRRLVKILVVVAFIFGVLFFCTVRINSSNWTLALFYMLGIILANVPEGLLITLIVCTSLSAMLLRRKHCHVKHLLAVEALGSTSCICTDKTGVVTRNRISVSHLWCNFKIHDKHDHFEVADPIYSQLCLAACLNLRASFTAETMQLPVHRRVIVGDASETAILRYMEINRSATRVRQANPKVAEIPFNSVNKYQVTIHRLKDKSSYYLVMKGAPECIVSSCSKLLTSSGTQDLTPETKTLLQSTFLKIANMGEKMIAYCDYELPVKKFPSDYKFNIEKPNFPLTNLRFLGIISLLDPPRGEVKDAIKVCRDAGIRVTMITGDHPVTALSVSKQVGIITQPTAYDYAFENNIDLNQMPPNIRSQLKSTVITGAELRKMSKVQLQRTLLRYQEITFARTSAQQKLFIVETYQSLGHVVAVTGNGVNDAPALKQANVGISMGITGSEVSKLAADVILLDDNFASIVLGIQEGRRIFGNLRKVIAYILTSNTPATLPFVLYACFGFPMPITHMLVLLINLGTDLLPAMSLTYEVSEEDVMKIPPGKVTHGLVNRPLLYMAYFQIGVVQFFAGLYAYFCVFASQGFFPGSLIFVREVWDNPQERVIDSYGRYWFYLDRKIVEQKAQTAYFVAVCWTQLANVVICKTRKVSIVEKGMYNYVLNASIVLVFIGVIMIVYLPLFHEVFSTESLYMLELILPVPYVVFIIFSDELRRYIIRRGVIEWVEKETCY